MKLLTRTRGPALSDRLTWQAASLLLAYPDEQRTARLDTVEELLSHVGGSAAKLLRATAASLRASDSIQAEIDYVETFDLRRRCDDVPDLLDCRGHPQPRQPDARVRRGLPRGRRRTADAARRPTTCRWCWSSPRPSTRWRGGGCSSSTGCRSTCCVRRWHKRIRRTRMPSPRYARRCRRPPTPTCDGRSGWRRPVPPPNRLVCNRLR